MTPAERRIISLKVQLRRSKRKIKMVRMYGAKFLTPRKAFNKPKRRPDRGAQAPANVQGRTIEEALEMFQRPQPLITRWRMGREPGPQANGDTPAAQLMGNHNEHLEIANGGR